MAVQLPPAGGRERQPIGLGKELERLVEFEEVGYALADERGLQGPSLGNRG